MKHLLLCLFTLGTTLAAYAETAELKATEGKLTPAEPPKLQDRMEGSKAAATAAAAGAASGKVNCLMLTGQANQEEDKNKKMLLMFMANQQCQQASALEQSAKQNDSSRKALSMSDVPKQAKFEAGTTSLETGSVKEVQIDFDENAPTRTSLLDTSDLAPPANTSSPGGKSETKPEMSPQEGVNAQASPPAQTLNPIEKGKVGFDDSAKDALVPQLGMGMPLPTSPGKPDSNNSAPTATPPSLESAPGRRRAIASDAGVGSGAESSDRGAGASGDEAMDALMSQLMGPDGGPAEEGTAQVGGQMWVGNDFPATESSERVNIFEYATVRYSKLKTDDKRLGGKPIAAAPRALASAKP